jgi:hypothetical protein
MERFIMPRGTGKTYQLILKSAETNQPILVHNNVLKKYVQKIANNHKIEIPTPISVGDILCGKCRGRHYNGVLVDELETVMRQFVSYFLSAPMTGYSMSIDN